MVLLPQSWVLGLQVWVTTSDWGCGFDSRFSFLQAVLLLFWDCCVYCVRVFENRQISQMWNLKGLWREIETCEGRHGRFSFLNGFAELEIANILGEAHCVDCQRMWKSSLEHGFRLMKIEGNTPCSHPEGNSRNPRLCCCFEQMASLPFSVPSFLP